MRHASVPIIFCTLALAACADELPVQPPGETGARYAVGANSTPEVWVVDQSNSNGLTYGGAIHIFAVPDLMGEAAATAEPVATIDLSGATAALCMAQTGANPVRPHMLFFNSTHTHGVLSFVVSGHVVIFDGASRAPKACIRMSAGAGGARQAHAAFLTPDDRHILVANQNGKLLERIDTDYATNSYVHATGATLDLANCTTPNGVACQDPTLRPDNAPICPRVGSSNVAWVTLRGGGLLVVDPDQTPMAIIGEYDRATVHPNGCGGTETHGYMWLNSGGGTPNNLHEFDVYRFPLTGYSASNPPNTPARLLMFSDDVEPRDAHGTTLVGGNVWIFDRGANVAEVFDGASGEHVSTVSLLGGPSSDPTPDLADVVASGNRVFVSLRGPVPLSGDPHVSTGSTPGIGVVQIQEGGARGLLKSVVPISNRDAAGIERADPHGIRVRAPR
ncbi:MAG TPA: hypothetical protein VGD27_01690 [Longimicrobiales bacterium]